MFILKNKNVPSGYFSLTPIPQQHFFHILFYADALGSRKFVLGQSVGGEALEQGQEPQ
jgi:hypothetical protein